MTTMRATLTTTICLLAARALSAYPQEAALRIGFQKEADLLECLPGDQVTFVEVDGVKAMRWDVNYAGKAE